MLELPAVTWKPLAAVAAPGPEQPSAVWTGSKMIVFGGLARGDGCRPQCALNDGASYDPATDRWAPIAPAPVAGRSGHSAVWVQDRMVVWGGATEGGRPSADGAAYDPAADSLDGAAAGPLEARIAHRTVATAHRMLVWGGSSGEGQTGKYFADGAIYSPADNAVDADGAAPRDPRGRRPGQLQQRLDRREDAGVGRLQPQRDVQPLQPRRRRRSTTCAATSGS